MWLIERFQRQMDLSQTRRTPQNGDVPCGVALHHPKRGTLKKSHATHRQKSYVRGDKFPFRPVFFYLEVGLLPLQAESNGSSNYQVGYNKSCKSTTPSHLYPWLQPKWFPSFASLNITLANFQRVPLSTLNPPTTKTSIKSFTSVFPNSL